MLDCDERFRPRGPAPRRRTDRRRRSSAPPIRRPSSARGASPSAKAGPPTEIDETDRRDSRREIAQLDADVAAAKNYRLALEAIVKDIRRAKRRIAILAKQIDAIETESSSRLERQTPRSLSRTRRPPASGSIAGPVLDALYTGNIKLDQIWLPDMKINYNFSNVARYDRCINCHRAIDKTAPGSATEPAYPAIPRDQRERIVELQTPRSRADSHQGRGRERNAAVARLGVRHHARRRSAG